MTATAAYRPSETYNEDVVRKFTLATVFWGVVAFAAGVFIALQLAFPELNLGLPWTTFGRLRPVHTSAAIFASSMIGSVIGSPALCAIFAFASASAISMARTRRPFSRFCFAMPPCILQIV